MPSKSELLLEKIVELNRCPLLDKPTCERVLAVQFVENQERTTPFFLIYDARLASESGALIKTAELRVPTSSSPSNDGLVVITPADDCNLSSQTLKTKFGKPSDVIAPPPEASRSKSVTYTFEINGRPVKFALGPGKSDKVVLIVLDRTQKG